jgi:hypothetical protein
MIYWYYIFDNIFFSLNGHKNVQEGSGSGRILIQLLIGLPDPDSGLRIQDTKEII